MPRPGQRIKVTDDQLQAILANARLPLSERKTNHELARSLGLSRLTIRRHLYKHGLASSNSISVIGMTGIPAADLWTRPCMACGDTSPRPRWQYFCRRHSKDSSS